MADIKGQLIKDSYNYVLQADIATGIVYRIGGAVPTNLIFQSGITVNGSFTYSDGSQQNGYVLTCDASGNATWRPISGATPSSGVTSITVGNGLSANTTTGNVTIVFTGNTGVTGDFLPLSGGTVTGNTTFTSGLTVNYINFDTTPNVPSPTGGTVFFDSDTNSLSYKPITNNNDVTINIGQENVVPIYNDTGITILNGQALNITGSTGTESTVRLASAAGGFNTAYQVDGVATHDIPSGTVGFMTKFGYVHDLNLSAFSNGDDVYLSETTPGSYSLFSALTYSARTSQIGHIINNSSTTGILSVDIINEGNATLPQELDRILTLDNSSTGVFDFTGLTRINSTQVSVGPIKGYIVNNVTDPTNPSIQFISYPGISALTLTNITTADITYFYLNSGNTISQKTTILNEEEKRKNIYLGYAAHPRPGNNIVNVVSRPDQILSPVSQLRDMFDPFPLINGGITVSPNTGLTINTNAGYIYGLGINFTTDRWSPNSKYINAQTPVSFAYRTQTGGTSTTTTNIDPTLYDVNGVATTISGNKATNQRIYINSIGVIRIQYGQHVYATLAEAIQNIQTETFTTFTTIKDTGVLIGILSVLKNATNLTDTAEAQFFQVSKFGETVGSAGGASTTTLQQAYNNSSEPEILINSTLDGLSIRNGTGNADNTTQLLQGQNTAGTTTSFMRADGLISGSSLSTPSFTANTTGLLVGLTPSLYTTTSTTVTTGTNTIYSVSKTLYNSIFIDYSLSGSTGKRAGTIVGVWDGSSIEYNETSTKDIGDTSSVTFSLALNSTADLIAIISSSTWLVKTIIKSI